ncbi:SDR family NAD(P)-dependent oxidoreductase [Williamsia deligens]|uniref:SDR family NAD(P)-dependent oxidoreductase n=1 Tax=Williamsia deligens TaxID=321325 RepID=A0ABW3G1J0_9NOCA|nr:SDR family NAD(P)-dependent oxidoreductase [Williamsia deligens]MCP2194936.1 Short-chain dehydrogenase [Williamsia deligens]
MNPLLTGVDALLDRLVVPGYSRIGSSVRRRFWAPDPEPFAERTDIVVTGGSSGLGAATAVGLTRLGARVHLVGRSADRLEESARRIRDRVPGADLVIRPCDISDLDAVRGLAADLTTDLDSLHAVVHSAGVMPPERTLSAQGHESAFATHVLGPVALTVGLLPLLRDDSRVVFVSSGGMYPVPLRDTDFEYEKGDYSGLTAYARTKRMQVVVAEQLAERITGDRSPVTESAPVVHSMHPGWADTPGVTDSIPGFAKVVGPILRTDTDGADTIVWLCAAPEAARSTGLFWHDRAPRPTHYPSWRRDDPAARDALWHRIVEATSIDPTTLGRG